MQLIYTAWVLQTVHATQLKELRLRDSLSYRNSELVVDALEVCSPKRSYECASLPWEKPMLLYLHKFYAPWKNKSP